jgi:hypothetical protein
MARMLVRILKEMQGEEVACSGIDVVNVEEQQEQPKEKAWTQLCGAIPHAYRTC